MIRLLDKTKVSFFDYFYLLSVIIYAGMASEFVRGFGDVRTAGNAVLLALTILFALHKHVQIRMDFFLFIGVFAMWGVGTILTTGSTQFLLWESMRWSMYLIVSYVICKGYGYRFFALAETILFHLTLIALFFWVIQLIMPGTLYEVISSIALPAFNDDDRFVTSNILIYTISRSSVFGGGAGEGWYLITRNSGFAWEPGAFACFLCFAVAFNAMRTNLKFKRNLPLIVFLIALATTQSTTGYVTMGAMLAVWFLLNGKIGWAIALIPIVLMILNLPFMSEKITENMEGFQDVSLSGVQGGMGYDRTWSFMLLLEEFTLHPIFGYGFSEANFMQFEITTFSGLGHLLAQFGIIITFLFVFLLVKASLNINKYYSNRSGWMIMVAMIGMMVSYMLWTHPLFISVWMSSVFMKDRIRANVSVSPKVKINNGSTIYSR